MSPQSNGTRHLSQRAVAPLGQDRIAHGNESMGLFTTVAPAPDLPSFDVDMVPSQSVDTTQAGHNNGYDSGYGSSSPSCHCECHFAIGSSQADYSMKPTY